MLTITHIDHIGQVVPDLEKQVGLLEGLFGFKQRETWDTGGHRGAVLDVPGRSGIRWEVLSPTAEASDLHAFIDSPRGPGVHHVGVQVANFDAAHAEARELGIVAGGDGKHWIDAWMNPKAAEGLMFRFSGDGFADACGGPANPKAEPLTAADGTLGVTGIDHICQAYWDRDDLARWYEKVLGMREIWRTPDGEHDDLADLVMEVPGGQLFWEVIMPVGQESFIERFVETRGSSAHHVTFEVADWAGAMAACDRHEIPTFDPNEGETDGARWQDAFIHPKFTGGMLVQLFWEEKPGVWVRSDKVPSGG